MKRSAAVRRWIAIVIAAGSLSVAPLARATDWPTPGLDAARSRLSIERSGASFADGQWTSSPAATQMLASPAVADGVAVTADLTGVVRAVRAEDGHLLWQAKAGSSAQGGPTVDHGRVFVPSLDDHLYAFGLADGAPLWSVDLQGMLYASPAPTGDGDLVITVGLPQRHLVRLHGDSGQIVWQSASTLPELSSAAVAVGGGLAVVGANGGHYVAFDLTTGQPRWQYEAGGVVNLASPLIVVGASGGRVYMAPGGSSDQVHAVDVATGQPIAGWPVTLPTPAVDVPGTRLSRQRAVSSFVVAGGVLILETRLDDGIDANGDGDADQYLSRESILGLDAGDGHVVWQVDTARTVATDLNAVPKFWVCPTPAAFAADPGASLIAATSTLVPVVRVLDAASGEERWRGPLAGPALASPVLANGRLFSASVGGALDAFLSSVNHPPDAPAPISPGVPVDAFDVTLHWQPSIDPDGEASSYELRIDRDGEVLQSWEQSVTVSAGAVSAHLDVPLAPDASYVFALRARDPSGALSSWSTLGTVVTAAGPPAVALGGVPVASLLAALAAAHAGDVVMLGAGTYTLSSTAHVAAGVRLVGSGAGRTLLNAAGLDVGISLEAATSTQPATLEKVAVAGAATCVNVGGGRGASLMHVVLRDCSTAAVNVGVGGDTTIINATLFGGGTGARSAGALAIRNSLLTGFAVGLTSDGAGTIASQYDDLFDNGQDYKGPAPGTNDLAEAVRFVDQPGRDLHVVAAQASTDRGDPRDDATAEPEPNGGRINIGAFGGTAEAELSASSTAAVTAIPSAATPEADSPGSAASGSAGGCAIGGELGSSVHVGAFAAAAMALALLGRRRRSSRRARD
ncbi:MAG TPA: PQQ-binding-like beta-propeller repeat protein [Polyangia bacterium]|jgi:outer membrane protein assembly factor BamB/chitodextrinase|nr:PQQ-binding-like beta-propeller repeat protein [Polyangia bacterium]